MQKTFAKLAKAAYLRTQAECFITSVIAEMHKEKPDLIHVCQAAKSARSALAAMRPVQASIERKTVLILSELVHEK